jgi:hypothetical protein
MYVKRLAAAAAIGIAGLMPATASAGAFPLDPPAPCADCQQNPAAPAPAPKPKPCWTGGRVGPGSPRGGGGQPAYPPQCHPSTQQP